MLELNQEQRRALNAPTEYPPRIINPDTGEIFVLIRQEMYHRIHAILVEEDEIAAIEETYPLVSEVLEREEMSSQENR